MPTTRTILNLTRVALCGQVATCDACAVVSIPRGYTSFVRRVLRVVLRRVVLRLLCRKLGKRGAIC